MLVDPLIQKKIICNHDMEIDESGCIIDNDTSEGKLNRRQDSIEVSFIFIVL